MKAGTIIAIQWHRDTVALAIETSDGEIIETDPFISQTGVHYHIGMEVQIDEEAKSFHVQAPSVANPDV